MNTTIHKYHDYYLIFIFGKSHSSRFLKWSHKIRYLNSIDWIICDSEISLSNLRMHQCPSVWLSSLSEHLQYFRFYWNFNVCNFVVVFWSLLHKIGFWQIEISCGCEIWKKMYLYDGCLVRWYDITVWLHKLLFSWIALVFNNFPLKTSLRKTTNVRKVVFFCKTAQHYTWTVVELFREFKISKLFFFLPYDARYYCRVTVSRLIQKVYHKVKSSHYPKRDVFTSSSL